MRPLVEKGGDLGSGAVGAARPAISRKAWDFVLVEPPQLPLRHRSRLRRDEVPQRVVGVIPAHPILIGLRVRLCNNPPQAP